MKPILTAAVAAMTIPTLSLAATLNYDSYTGTHFHSGGNVGGDYVATTNADRAKDITRSPSGLVMGSEADKYEGNIGTVVGTRVGRAETNANTIGLMQDDGFFFRSEVNTKTTCVETNIVGCLPFMANQARVQFDFTVSEDVTMYVDGSWVGGNEDPATISTQDFLGLQVQRVLATGGALPVFSGVDTNRAQNGQDFGAISESFSLREGTTYRFGFNQRAYAQSLSATGAMDQDAAFLAFSASFNTTQDVSFFEARYAAQLAPVPLPAAGWLMIAGLGAIGAMRRRR